MGRTAKIVIIVVIVAATTGIALWTWQSRQGEEPPRTVIAARRDVIQDVTFTGRLQAQQSAELSFEVAGTVTEILVGIGDTVEEGEQLISLDTTKAQLEIAEARANQAAAEEESYLTWQQKEQEWTNLKAENARTLEKKRQAVRDAKAELEQDKVVHADTARDDGDNATTTQTALATLKAAESTYHAAQQSFSESLKATTKTSQSARSAAGVAQAQYLGTKQTAPNIAGLSSLQAGESITRHKIVQSTVKAPFKGIVIAKEIELGEYVAAGTTVLTIATTDRLELVADVPETDATKVNVDMPATVTFDALPPQERSQAKVTRLAPAAEIIEGVPTYEITLQLDSFTEQHRPGLTSNITVHAAQRKDVIAIPRRAVITREAQQFVRLLQSDGQITEQKITTGLAGSDGSIEVASGLNEGQQVVTGTTQ